MMGKTSCIAIVMGRGGSKRIPGKNVRAFCGKPMVCWPVEKAVSCGFFSEVIISTDSLEIAKAAQCSGAAFYGLRPPALSNDYATTGDVLDYELACYKTRVGSYPTYCCCLYATSALITADCIQAAYAVVQGGDAELVMAAIRYGHPIERSFQFTEQGLFEYRWPEYVPQRTQDIKPSYHDAGLFYFFDAPSFMAYGAKSFVPMKKQAIEVSARDAVDIDTEDDWEYAEYLCRKKLAE